MSHRPARLPMLRPRQVHDAEEGSRHASWLELFFDLVFVVAVAQLAVALHDDHDLRGFLTYAGLFVPIWWAWISFSYFSDLFDDNRPFDRLVQLAAMFGIAVVAVSLAGGIADDADLFAGAFGAMFVLLGALYLHAARTAPDIRQFCRWYAAGSFTGAALWLTSMAVPEPGRYWLWGMAVLANAMISGPIAYARLSAVPHQVSHMDERFGLFTIVVLGESVLAVVNGLEAESWDAGVVATAVAGFVIAASIWWVYFDAFDEDAIDRAIAGGRGARVRSFLYGYGHLLIYAAIAAVGVGVQVAIEEAAHGGEPVALLAGTLALLIVGFFTHGLGIGGQWVWVLFFAKLAVAAVGVIALFAFDSAVTAIIVTALAWAILVVIEIVVQGQRQTSLQSSERT